MNKQGKIALVMTLLLPVVVFGFELLVPTRLFWSRLESAIVWSAGTGLFIYIAATVGLWISFAVSTEKDDE